MSDWINIDRLGTKGMEPDLMPPHREPQSLDVAVNVRSLGPNIANAGGYVPVANGDIPDQVETAICACPDMFFSESVQDGSIHVDRSWKWDPNNIAHWLTVLEINRDGEDYDQTVEVRYGECDSQRRGRAELQILNTASARRIKVVQYDGTGAVVGTPLDYDASAQFGDGLRHWVTIEQWDPGGGQIGYEFFIDSTSISRAEYSIGDTSAFIEFRRTNSPAGLSLPVALWQYSQTLRDCLISGSFNGFGRCVPIIQNTALVFGRTDTDDDILLYNGYRIATPAIGAATQRSAYVDHKAISSPIYWEWFRGLNASCHATAVTIGGAGRYLILDSNAPGTVVDSWGYSQSDASLRADNSILASGIAFNNRMLFAYDPTTGELWIGQGDASPPTWHGGGTPGNGATSWVVRPNDKDFRLVAGFINNDVAVNFLSSEDSCRFAAPDGFGYLE